MANKTNGTVTAPQGYIMGQVNQESGRTDYSHIHVKYDSKKSILHNAINILFNGNIIIDRKINAKRNKPTIAAKRPQITDGGS